MSCTVVGGKQGHAPSKIVTEVKASGHHMSRTVVGVKQGHAPSKIVTEVKASGHHMSRTVVGGKQGHAASKISLLQQSLRTPHVSYCGWG